LHRLSPVASLFALLFSVSAALAIQSAAPSPARKTSKSKTTLPAATKKDVADALSRVFGHAVLGDNTTAPTFIQGDFNGDGSRDLAVIVKPNAALAELNNPLANWEVEDPTNIPLPDPTKRVQRLPAKPARPVIEKADSLLIILHGLGVDGWRDSQARQAYVLKNNSAADLQRLPKSRVHRPAHDPRFPALLGDAIHEVLQGQGGFIYWTGAQYAFYPYTAAAK
jgi:hypothetical protein